MDKRKIEIIDRFNEEISKHSTSAIEELIREQIRADMVAIYMGYLPEEWPDDLGPGTLGDILSHLLLHGIPEGWTKEQLECAKQKIYLTELPSTARPVTPSAKQGNRKAAGENR